MINNKQISSRIAGRQQQTMFLNLKNKKVAETTTTNNKQPKTQREEIKERNSKEHKEVKSYRQHQQQNKKGHVSTATTTIQPSHSTFNNFGLKIKIKDPVEREPMDSLSHSQEKVDSYRLARVTSAYKKIKRIDNNDSNLGVEELDKSQQRLRRTLNRPHKTGLKKQMLNNIVHNYICVTEADDNESKIMEKINSGRGEIMQQLLDPFVELFGHTKQQRFKERSFSHRQLQVKRSGKLVEKQRKKKSNEILIKEDEVSSAEGQTIDIFMKKFYVKLDKVREKIDSVNNSKKYKYVQSPAILIFQQLYQDVEEFTNNIYQLCLKQIDCRLKKCQQIVSALVLEEQKAQQKLHDIEKVLSFEKNKTMMLEQMVQQFQDKSLYSTIFLNQLSFGFDVDSCIRDKLFQEAKKNGLISEYSESRMEDQPFDKNYKSQGAELREKGENLYDNNRNQFIGYNISGFGNCLGTKRKQDDNF